MIGFSIHESHEEQDLGRCRDMSRRRYDGSEDPLTILDQRLASGEIGRAEYDELKKVVQSSRSTTSRGHNRALSRSGLTILVVLGVVLAFTITSLALTYGPWRAPQSGTPSGWGWGWGDCCTWGAGTGGMGGGMMGGDTGGYGQSDVVIANYAYSPQVFTVSVGSTVTWVNMDGAMHTVSFGEHGHDHGGEAMDSGPMYHMDGWSYTFNEPGVYEYHCDPHPFMTGTVVVKE